MPNVDPDRTDRRGIAQTGAYAVGVLRAEAAKPDAAEDVAAIVKNRSAEFAHDLERKAQLGVQDDQLRTAKGHADPGAGGSVIGVAADKNRALRAGSVERESTQRTSTSGEKTFAERYMRSGG